MNLKELRDAQQKVVVEARERLDLITSNTDEARSAELEASHDKAMAEFDRLEALISRAEKTEAAEQRAEALRAKQRPTPADGETGGQDDGAALDYRGAFIQLARAGFNPQEISAEARAVIKAGIAEFRAQSTTAGAGGYTVPTDLARVIDKTLKAWGPMYDEDICTVITTASGNNLDFPKTDDTAVAAAQHTEAAAMTDDGGVDATFTKMTLGAFAYDTEWVQISMELLQDSAVDIEQFIGELLGERLARRVNTELTTGDGTGDPLGIVAASTLGVTAAGAAAVTFDELFDLYHAVDPAYRASPKARWMFNDGTLKAVRKLKGGDGQYIWQMGDVRAGAPATLLDKPYSINQAVPAMTTGLKSIVFGDFSKYYVRKVGAPVVGVRREYYWPNIGLAGVVRLDGDLIQTGAVKHLIQA